MTFRDKQERENPHFDFSRPPARSFTELAAGYLGCTARTLQQTIRIAERIPPRLQTALSSTPIADRKEDLSRIAGMNAEDHRQLLERLKTDPQPATLDAALARIP